MINDEEYYQILRDHIKTLASRLGVGRIREERKFETLAELRKTACQYLGESVIDPFSKMPAQPVVRLLKAIEKTEATEKEALDSRQWTKYLETLLASKGDK